MKRFRACVQWMTIVGLAFGLTAGLAWAQDQPKPESKEATPAPGAMMPGRPGMPGMQRPTMRPGMEMDQSPEQMINMRADMMKRMGVADDKITQWKSVMGVQIQPDSPEGLVGLKEQLKLTDEQVKQLETIEKDAQQKAMGVLTAEQKTKFEEVKFKPGSVMELSTMMTREMRESRMGGRRMMEGARPGAPEQPGAPAMPGAPVPPVPPAPEPQQEK